MPHDKSFQVETGGCINLEDILNGRHQMTPGKLMVVIYTDPTARLQLTFPADRVSSHGLRRFLVPEIGIRATQGHSLREDVGPEALWVHRRVFVERKIPMIAFHVFVRMGPHWLLGIKFCQGLCL